MHIYVYTFSEYNFILSIGRFSSDLYTCAVADTLTIHIHTHTNINLIIFILKRLHHVKSLPIVLKNFITCFSFDFQKIYITFFPKHAFKELRSSIRNSYIFLGNGTSWVLGICLQGNQYKKVISITTKHWESGIRSIWANLLLQPHLKMLAGPRVISGFRNRMSSPGLCLWLPQHDGWQRISQTAFSIMTQ